MPTQGFVVAGSGDPPPAFAKDLLALAVALDAAVPPKQLDRNLIIGTWNIRQLARFTPRWEFREGDSPKRNLADLWMIAEILSRFDVVAVQETRDQLEGLRMVLKALGPDWSFIVSDVTAGAAGNRERLAFLYDQRRVRPSGLAGELVLSPEDLERIEGGLDHQFVRTPYMVSFATRGRPFTLATVHVVWGDTVAARTAEARALAALLARAVHNPSRDSIDDFRANLITLGDFNIGKADDETFKALAQDGLQPDPSLIGLRRTVDDRATDPTAYDQMAWFTPGHEGALNFPHTASGTFPWSDHVLPDAESKTFRISDHFPLWAEFDVSRR